MADVKTYRSIFISDVHLGWNKSHCGDAALMLDSLTCDTLYLVGDIFDGWKFRRRWFWDDDHDLFVSAVLRKVDAGTKVIYMPGNHDESLRNPALRGVLKSLFNHYGVGFVKDTIHRTADGRDILVIHGDQFDTGFIRSISHSADALYNGTLERIKGLGRPKKVKKEGAFSLARYFRKIARGTVDATGTSNRAYLSVIREKVKDRQVDGVIMGHSHIPCNTDDPAFTMMPDRFFYGNCGDWIDSSTMLAENRDGSFTLLKARNELKHSYYHDHKKLAKKDKLVLHPKAPRIRRWAQDLWAPRQKPLHAIRSLATRPFKNPQPK